MITQDDILPFGRYKYAQPVTGSCNGMRYKIVHPKPSEGEENLIYVDVWPGPWCYEATDEENITKNSFEYSREGYDRMLAYLNELYDSRREEWEQKENCSYVTKR